MGIAHFQDHKNNVLQSRDKIRNLEEQLALEKSRIRKSLSYFAMRKINGLASKAPLKRNGYDVEDIKYTSHYPASIRVKRKCQIYTYILRGYKTDTICRKVGIKESTFNRYVMDIHKDILSGKSQEE